MVTNQENYHQLGILGLNTLLFCSHQRGFQQQQAIVFNDEATIILLYATCTAPKNRQMKTLAVDRGTQFLFASKKTCNTLYTLYEY